MIHKTTKIGALAVPMILTCATLCNSALAADTLDEIIVQGSRVSKSIVGTNPSMGTPREKVALSHAVDYSDLDLTTTLGAKELERRVGVEAVTVCEQLNKLFPVMREDPDCASNATKQGLQRAHEVIMAKSNAKAALKSK